MITRSQILSQPLRMPDSRQRLEQLTLWRRAIRGFGEHRRQTPSEQGIARRLGGKLDGQWDEPGSLARAGACPRDSGILLEERQEESTLGRKLSVDGALGEPGSLRDVVEGPKLQAPFGKHPQARLHKESAGFALAALTDDSHGYLGYASVPVRQGQITQNRQLGY